MDPMISVVVGVAHVMAARLAELVPVAVKDPVRVERIPVVAEVIIIDLPLAEVAAQLCPLVELQAGLGFHHLEVLPVELECLERLHTRDSVDTTKRPASLRRCRRAERSADTHLAAAPVLGIASRNLRPRRKPGGTSCSS